MKITIDTNIIRADEFDKLLSECKSKGWDVAVVSVTGREPGGTDWDIKFEPLLKMPETLVLDESCLNEAILGNKNSQDDLQEILEIISSGSYPKMGNNLSEGFRRQLRDAMIFQAHLREDRDVFVTNDEHDFIRDGRREKLQNKFDTKILTKDEFSAFLLNSP